MEFDYTAKAGIRRRLRLHDRDLASAMRMMRARRTPPQSRLLAFKDGRLWRELTSDDVSSYIKLIACEDCSAKDFRTWHATVLAASLLALADRSSKAARRRSVKTVMDEAAELLGNTPAVAKASYIDPRLVDLFERGVTIDPGLAQRSVDSSGDAPDPRVERAVGRLLEA